ncbi:3-ketoacyl-ACP reductase [Sphingomonas sp. DBB INV C78]|uniref:SDR family NAD(P)-dependent oxidoreductase n=1 Tax=Sphingomonas sp. DBB INV C78 TaxID=3349434 RepID=UPI0036D3D4E1
MKGFVRDLLCLEGKVAVVTGGALGIGRAVARRLAEAGAAVLLTDINGEALAEAVDHMTAEGLAVYGIASDASLATAGETVVQAALDRFGGIDILVNNAGIYLPGAVLEVSEAEYDLMVDLNIKGMYFHAQAAARVMVREKRGGRIVNLSSPAAVRPNRLLSVYATTKGAVNSATKAMAKELGQHAITVNAVLPGSVDTHGTDVARARMIERLGEQRFTNDGGPTVLGHRGDPVDVANAVLFLASDMAGYITGASLSVDGGYQL